MESLHKLAKHCAIIVFALAFCLPEISEAATFYRITPLTAERHDSYFPILSINNKGQIVGSFYRPYSGIQNHAFLWTASNGMQDLVILPDYQSGVPFDINDDGQVIGLLWRGWYVDVAYRSVLWKINGGIQDLGTVIYNPKINNIGQIVGFIESISGDYTYAHLVMLNNTGAMQDLTERFHLEIDTFTGTEPLVAAINDNGQIVVPSGDTYLLLDTISGTQTPIPLSGHSSPLEPISINNSGQITGVDLVPHQGGSGLIYPFIWSMANGIYHLPTIFGPDHTGATYSPLSINNSSQVVGTIDYNRAFIWSAVDGMKELNDLIDPADPLKGKIAIRVATDINDHGQIVATAYYDEFGGGGGGLEVNTGVLLTPSSPSPTIDLLDPVPALLEGSAVSTNPDSLAKKGRLVEGVGADGVATLVLRIHAKSVGESITLTLDGASTDEAGALGVLGATPDALTTTVTAESTTEGPMAFALYRAPVDFAWNESHHSLQRRSVTLNASSSSGSFTTKSIDVVRPPVVLVHGVWSDSSVWNEFTPLISFIRDKAIFVHNFNYKSTNAEAIATNAKRLFDALDLLIDIYSVVHNVAIAQADIIAHSMGGLIARSLPAHKDDKFSRRNFNKGYVHKLITIGTPHLGSPIANELINPKNACFNEATDLVVKADGAVGDLIGKGDGTGLSTALARLQKLPMTMLAGQANAIVYGLKPAANLVAKLWWCNAPIIDKFTDINYIYLMGTKEHDGIVPVTSALNNQREVGWIWEGPLVMHSKDVAEGIEFFTGYKADHLLESDSVLSNKVVDLLNTPVNSTEFIQP